MDPGSYNCRRLVFVGTLLIGIFSTAYSSCTRGCDVALVSYYVWRGSSLQLISDMTQVSIPIILSYNPHITNQHYLLTGTRVNVPISCDCLGGGEFLGHVFSFNTTPGATYELIAETCYANLTNAERVERWNSFPAGKIGERGVKLKVAVNCSSGDENVSGDYGLFVTYPVRVEETMESVAAHNNLSLDLVRRYNPWVNHVRIFLI